MGLAELRSRQKALEKAVALHSGQHAHHTSEAAKHARELHEAQIRLDEINRFLLPQTTKSPVPQQKEHTGNAAKRRPFGPQPYHSEGPTVVIVRLLYEHREGMTVYEMQTRNGIAIKPDRVRKIVGRLIKAGHAKKERQKVILLEPGIKKWEASPLFLHSQRNAALRAAS
jgi:hypothetical protein